MSGATGIQRAVLKLGTRGSKLALIQSEIVRAALLAAHPELDVQLETITTMGDAVQDRPLNQVGGNGLFVRQIEISLRDGQIDLAVHSAKDLPSSLAPGTAIAAYLPRADARDVLISSSGCTLADLPKGSKVGTSSPRRICQLRALRPDLVLLDIRGNVDTRLRKLREGQYDAIVLAAAGMERLGLLQQVTEYLDPSVMIPAVAQGALAVEIRADDSDLLSLVSTLDDPTTRAAVTAERAFLATVAGACSLPVAAHATLDGGLLHIAAMIGSDDGRSVRGERAVPVAQAEETASSLARELLDNGGLALIGRTSVQE
jgi:hydroxymethylbilane synthase